MSNFVKSSPNLSQLILFQVNEIRWNVQDSIVTILQAMTNIDPPVTTSDPALDSTRTWLLEYNGRPEFDYNTEFYEATESLWADAGVQQCFERSNEYQLIDCAKYFLDKVSEVKRDEFNPRLVFFYHIQMTLEFSKNVNQNSG